MDCPGCGHVNPSDAGFCGECGFPLAASTACPACGRSVEAGQKFCHGCGAGLEAAAPAEREPRDYTPRHLADRILRSKSALEGERKQVTVLFADVKGSMELAAQLDPEHWHGVLDRFFQILTDGIHRFEGTVNQYTGDGIMALFGAPIAHEDHAHRGCFAALQIRDTLREFTREVKRRHGLDFAVRIGINSGEVIVGKIGDDLRMDYTAQGHTVGLAQRMEALASGGSIYVGARTAGLVGPYFDLEDLGAFEIKGADETVEVFELRGTGGVRTRFDLSRARGLSRFVGRADEMALLEAAFQQSLAGPGRTLGVVAQAGTGKSRLCYEFVERCRARGITVYEARGLAHGKQIPLLPALEVTRAFFGIEERDSDRMVREKVAGRILLLDESLSEELPIFFDLLGAPDPARPLPAVDPEEIQRRLHAAVRSISRADAALDPQVILFEDLHWLDPASDAFLEKIIEGMVEARGLVLVNFRPEYRARWMGQSHYQQLSLLPLSEDALRELLRDLLGADTSVAELPDLIYERTGGNPFFIEEVVQSLVDEGHLAGARGAYQLVTPLRALPVPDSVQAVLAARIDRLPEREKQVLQAASVIGKTFRERVLQHAVGLPERDLEEALRNLQDGEFLYETALYPEREYTFKHPLTQQVADGSQLSERRIRAHAAVARAIEELEAERLDEHAAVLAQHWERAEEPLLAARWHARAAARIGHTDYAEAYRHWQRIDALLRNTDPDAEVAELVGRACGEQLRLAFRVGIGEEEADEIFARGRAYHEAHGDDRQLALLICSYSAVIQAKGRLPEYLERTRESRDIAVRSGDLAVRAAVALDFVYCRILCGPLDQALEAAEEAVSLASGDVEFGADLLGYSPLVTNLAFGGFVLFLMGRLDEAEEWMQSAQRLVPDDTAPETLGWLNCWRGDLQLARGDAAGALRTALRGVELAQRSGSRFDAVMSQGWLGLARVAQGSWREGAEVLERVEEKARATNTGLDMILLTRWALPLAYLGVGERERARDSAEEAVASCREEGARTYLCRSLYARAAVALARGDAAAAAGDLDEAQRIAEEIGARLFLGALEELRAGPAAESAREGHLRSAQRLFAEMGASGHAERVVRALR